MFLLERQSETVDNGAKYLEEFGNSVESLSFVGELEEDIVDGSADKGAQVEELAIDSVESRLEEISLAGVFRVEELEELKDKAMVNVGFGDVGVEILTLDEAQEEFINDLDMGPSNLQDGLILLWIESLTLGVDGRWNWAKQIFSEHVDDSGIHRFGDDLSIVGNVIEQLMQS